MASSPRHRPADLRPRPETGFTKSFLVAPPRDPPSGTALMQTSMSNSPRAAVATSMSVAERSSRLGPIGMETVCHGLLRDPRPGARPAAVTTIPDPLVFYSWWNEELATHPDYTTSGQGMGVRRNVKLHYLPSTDCFQLFTEDVKAALTLSIEHTDGTPVRPHELFVGATLDVLGRPMTLRSASAKTIAWVDAEAKRLLRRREALCAAIQKFQDVHKALETIGITQLYLNRLMDASTTAIPPDGGKANLARLTMEVHALEGLLQRYRS